jgi:hypothetical protein
LFNQLLFVVGSSNCVLSNKLLICMGMPSFAAVAPNGGALVPLQQQGSDSSDSSTAAVLHTVYHRVQGAPRILVSWGHGNCLRLSYLQQQHKPENESNPNGLQPAVAKGNGGGKVVEIELGKKDENQTLAEKRRIAYASVQAFAYLQSQQLMQIEAPSRAYGTDWYVLSVFFPLLRLLQNLGCKGTLRECGTPVFYNIGSLFLLLWGAGGNMC